MVNLSSKTIYARIARGWNEHKARTIPIYKRPELPKGMAQCSRCKGIKSLTEFYARKDRPGQHQPHCLACEKFRTRERRDAVRTKLIEYYSNGTNACARCGEARKAVLDIDHVNGGGIKDRSSHKTIHQYYMRLMRERFPVGYRVLCRNCNWLAWIERKDKSSEL